MGKYFSSSFDNPYKYASKYFKSSVPELTPSVEQRIRSLENQLTNQGVDVPPMVKRSLWDKIGDTLSVGQYSVMGGLKNLTDKEQWKNHGLDPMGIALEGSLKGIRAALPTAKGYEEGEASFDDVLSNLGWKAGSNEVKSSKYFNERLGVDINSKSMSLKDAGRGALVFGTDMVTDPTNWFTGGGKALLQGTTKSAVKSASKEAVEAGVKKATQELAEGEGKTILIKLGQDASEDNIKALISKIERQANVAPKVADDLKYGFGRNAKTLVKDETIRKIGDATIAPAYNKISDMLGNNETVQRFAKYFKSDKSILQGEAARKNTKELFKIHAFEQYAYDMNNTFKATQENFARTTKDLFQDLDENTQRLMSDVMERKEFWKDITTNEGEKTVSRMTVEAQQFKNNLEQIRNGWQGLVNKYEKINAYSAKLDDAKDMLNRIDNILNSNGRTFDEIRQSMSATSEFIKSMPKEQLYPFMNDFVYDDTYEIIRKLQDEIHIEPETARKMGGEIRAALDKARGNVDAAIQILWKGQEFEDEIVRVEGQAFDESWEALKRKTRGQMLARQEANKGMKNIPPMREDAIPAKKYSLNEVDEENEYDRIVRQAMKYLKDGHSEMKIVNSLSNQFGDESAVMIMQDARKLFNQNTNNIDLSELAIARKAETNKTMRDAYMENSYYKRNKHEQQAEDKMFEMAEKRQIDDIYNQKRKLASMYSDASAMYSGDDVPSGFGFDDYMKKEINNTRAEDFEAKRFANKPKKTNDVFDKIYAVEQKIKNEGGDQQFFLKYLNQELKKNNLAIDDYLRYTNALDQYKTFPNSNDPFRQDVIRNISKGNIAEEEFELYTTPFKDIDEQDFAKGDVRKQANAEMVFWLDRMTNAIKNNVSDAEILKAAYTRVGKERAEQYLELAKKSVRDEQSGGWEKLFANSGNKTEQVQKYFNVIKTGENPVKTGVEEIATTTAKFDVPPRMEYKTTTNKEVRDVFDYNGAKITSPVNSNPNVTPSMVKKGIDHITALNQKFGALLNDVTIRLLDLDSNAEATIKHSTKEIMLPNNPRFEGDALASRVKNRLLPHEVGHALQRELGIPDNIWNDIASKDKNIIPNGGEGASGDFTETLSLMMRNPQQLAERYPERFKSMQNIIKNYKPSMDSYRAAKLDADVRTLPKQARQTVLEAEEMLSKKQQTLMEEVANGGVLKEDAIKNLEKSNADLEMDNFEQRYRDEFGDDKIYEFTYETVNKVHRVLDDEAMKDIPLDTKAKRIMQIVKDDLKLMGTTENIDSMLDDYLTHVLRISESGKGANKLRKYGNVYNLQRRHKGTIKEINAYLKESYGIDDMFETVLSKIYLERGLRHNQIIFEKQFYEDLVDMFGERITDLSQKSTNRKLYASTSDVVAMLDKISPMSIDDAMINVNLTKGQKQKFIKAVNEVGIDRFNDIVNSLEFDDKTVQELADGLNRYDNTRKTELLKAHKLPLSLLEATQIGKGKFAMKPIVELEDSTFTVLKNMGKNFEAFTMSDVATEMVNRMGKIQMDDTRNAFLKAYDKFLRLWKLNQTSINLGFHARNMFSNQFNNYLAGGAEAVSPQTQLEAYQILNKTYGDIKLNGTTYTYEQIRTMFGKQGLMNEGAFTKDLFDSNSNALQNISDVVRGQNKKINLNPTDEKNFVAYKYGSQLGANVENHARMTNFIAQLKLGKDQYEAAEIVNKFLFDYNDLSNVERNVLKRLIPFYTWMRKNIPLQFEQLLVQPKTYRNVKKGLDAVRSMTPEEDRLSKEDTNDFARDWVQLPINTKGQSGNEEPVFWNPNMPFQDFNRLSAREAAGSLTPAIKLPIELATNHNWYFNSPISRGIGDTENAPGYFQMLTGQTDNPETKENEAMQMNPYLRHLLRNVASWENTSKLIETKGDDKLISALNALGGVKTYSYDVDTYRKWALRDRLKQLQDLKNSEQEKRNKR